MHNFFYLCSQRSNQLNQSRLKTLKAMDDHIKVTNSTTLVPTCVLLVNTSARDNLIVATIIIFWFPKSDCELPQT